MYDAMSSAAAASNTMLHLVILGVGLAVIAYDRDTPTTRAFAAIFALWGAQHVARTWLRTLGLWPPDPLWMQIGFLPGDLSSIAAAEYLLLVLRTASRSDAAVRAGLLMLRANQVVTIAAIIVGWLRPDLYENTYGGSPGFGAWLYQGLSWFSATTFVLPVLILLARRVDFQEKRRVLALVAGTPFFLMGPYLPSGVMNVVATLVGVLVILVGATGYLVMQGRRGEFLSRFLSPQIRERVQEQGLLRALHQSQSEITIVCCDLRGFTAYAQSQSSSLVIDVLKRYYDAAGEVTARFGATIKDFAGDGVLILVGAPEPRSDHASVGIELARSLLAEVRRVIAPYGASGPALGAGIGVASGVVTVGVVDSSSRMEYAAVGPAVNLAARLCSAAADGQVRISDRTAQLHGPASLRPLPGLALKGVGEDVPNYALPE